MSRRKNNIRRAKRQRQKARARQNKLMEVAKAIQVFGNTEEQVTERLWANPPTSTILYPT